MKTDILGIRFNNMTRAQALERLVEFLEDDGFTRTVVTPNPEMVMAAERDTEFRDILNLAGLVVPDGIGIVIASRLLGGGIRERVAGVELIEALFTKLSEMKAEGEQPRTVYLFGGKPGVAERAASRLEQAYSGIRVVGVRDGYFDSESAKLIAQNIGQAKPDILLVGLGFPKQEKFVDKHRALLNAKISIGCGGSLDVFAGEVERAPLVFRKLGLEWFYRLTRQPSRFSRMTVLPLFVLRVIAQRLRTGSKKGR